MKKSTKAHPGLFHTWRRLRKVSGGPVFGEEIEIRLLNILHQSSLACATVASEPFVSKQKTSMTASSHSRSGALLLHWERILSMKMCL